MSARDLLDGGLSVGNDLLWRSPIGRLIAASPVMLIRRSELTDREMNAFTIGRDLERIRQGRPTLPPRERAGGQRAHLRVV